MSTMFVSYDDIFASGVGFEVRHKTEFSSEAGEALRLTVRQSFETKGSSFKRLGRSVLVFDFHRAGAISAESSPTAAWPRAAPSYGDGGGEEAASAAAAAATAPEVAVETRVVFVHDRSNGAKQLYVNRKLVYSIKKDCTDGNLDTYVLSLPFGKTVLMLTAKLFSSSGFMYTLTLGVGKGGAVLYKSSR